MCTISIFPTSSSEGIELANRISDFLKSKEFNNGQVKIFYREENKRKNPDEKDKEYLNAAKAFLTACLSDDLVIFDATREDDGTNNFDIANEYSKSLEHFIIVSRNYLPINFYSIRNGGYPDYLISKINNNYILEWLKKEISKIELPRKTKKGYINYFSLMNAYSKKNKRKMNVFVSFRTKYQSKNNKEFPIGYKFSVEELSKRIENGYYHSGENKTVNFLENGNLVYDTELLTEQRRWQLVNTIDNDYIMTCDELWIYGSEDYLNSWWTRAELVVFSYWYFLYPNLQIKRKLCFYDPVKDKVYDIPKEKILFLNEVYLNKMTRLYSNCNPNTMGYEALKIIKKKYAYHFNPNQVSSDFFSKISALFKKNVVEKYAMPDNYLDDRIFEDSFWEQLLYSEAIDTHVYKQSSEFNCDFDVDKFFLLTEPPHIPAEIDFERQVAILASGKEIKIEEKNPRFIWMPNRMGKDVSTTQHNLEELKTIIKK